MCLVFEYNELKPGSNGSMKRGEVIVLCYLAVKPTAAPTHRAGQTSAARSLACPLVRSIACLVWSPIGLNDD